MTEGETPEVELEKQASGPEQEPEPLLVEGVKLPPLEEDKAPAKTRKPRSEVVKAEAMSLSEPPQDGLIQVRDGENHLLFCYNAITRRIEIKTRGKKYSVSVDTLKNIGARNLIADEPVRALDAEISEE